MRSKSKERVEAWSSPPPGPESVQLVLIPWTVLLNCLFQGLPCRSDCHLCTSGRNNPQEDRLPLLPGLCTETHSIQSQGRVQGRETQGQRDPMSPHIWERGKTKCCGFLWLGCRPGRLLSSGRNPNSSLTNRLGSQLPIPPPKRGQ